MHFTICCILSVKSKVQIIEKHNQKKSKNKLEIKKGVKKKKLR